MTTQAHNAQDSPARTGTGWLEGEVALVTGAGSGIGRAVVARFIFEGARVGAMVRSDADATSLREAFGPAVFVTQGDVRSAEDNARAVEGTVDAFGRLDTFVGNAGVWDYFLTLERMDAAKLSAAFDEIFAINVKGCLLGAHAAVRPLRESRGSMIFTVSNAGFYAGGGGPLYVASKHALVGVIRQLAYDLAPDIRVNGVAPGGTLTRLHGLEAAGDADRSLETVAGLEDRIADSMPLGFVARPEDHTGFYVVLASRQNSRFATAEIIQSDGGWEIRAAGRRPDQRRR
jgi:NAD(P)-dependent dehydrogenase (short-subunit alcohol dehydrogenase family)